VWLRRCAQRRRCGTARYRRRATAGSVEGDSSTRRRPGDQILYINDIPRSTEPWYEVFRKLAPRLLVEPFKTSDMHCEVQCDGWRNLVACLAKHAGGLSLPQGMTSPVEVVPADLRHKLELQDCFNALSGLGQHDELTLQREDVLAASRTAGRVSRKAFQIDDPAFHGRWSSYPTPGEQATTGTTLGVRLPKRRRDAGKRR
jgi:hypothetical protein